MTSRADLLQTTGAGTLTNEILSSFSFMLTFNLKNVSKEIFINKYNKYKMEDAFKIAFRNIVTRLSFGTLFMKKVLVLL